MKGCQFVHVSRRLPFGARCARLSLRAGCHARGSGPLTAGSASVSVGVPAAAAAASEARASRVNVELQVIGSALVAAAEEMGAALIRSAFSSNIKERRDCSTALFDARGRMIAQAEHIPVHLGAMPEAVAAVMARDPAPGEVFAVNDPFTGGTHLPDITLVSRTEAGFAVSRAHHADVGGMEPSSLPAESREIYQEGLVIPPVRLDDEVLRLFVANMRNPDERLGDLRAQLGAQSVAERRIAELCRKHGRDRIEAAMDELYAYSERRVRAGLRSLPDGVYEAADVLEPLEGELEIRARVTLAGEEIEIDFAGTSPQHDGNLNCPLSVTRSACYFVVRVLTAPDIPASGGAYAPVRVLAPEGCLVNARPTGRRRRRQHRDVEPHHGRRLPRARPGRGRGGPGTGDDEQPHLRQPSFHVLRDHRRRAGRLPR